MCRPCRPCRSRQSPCSGRPLVVPSRTLALPFAGLLRRTGETLSIHCPRAGNPGRKTGKGDCDMATQVTAHTERGFSFLRTAIVLQTLTLFLQAVSAGLLLTSSSGGTLHHVG
ncbi:hypothetical protein ACWDN2_33695, partial [Streptomyces cinereoruber]